MRCKCGWSFSAPRNRRKFESFAVVNDKDYQTFLRLENATQRSRGEDAKLCAIARASDYVGCLLACPACSRVLLLKPSAGSSDGSLTFYTKED